MSWQVQAEDAREALEKGEYGRAGQLYGELLEQCPEEIELQAGFFITAYWSNRKDSIQVRRAGRERADFIIAEWQNCRTALSGRGLADTGAAFSIKNSVLGQAAENFREAYQSGASTADTVAILKSLAIALLEMEDLLNAAEVAAFASRQNKRDAHLLFVHAEALARQQDPLQHIEGLSCMRDACLLDHRKLDPQILISQPGRLVFEELIKAESGDLTRAIDWFPAYLMARLMPIRLRHIEYEEMRRILAEQDRLQQDLQQTPPKFQERVRAVLSFHILCLLQYQQFTEPDRSRMLAWETELCRIAPELTDYLQEIREKSRGS